MDSQFSINNHNLYDLLKQTIKSWRFFLLTVVILNILVQPFLLDLQLGEKKLQTVKIDFRFNNFIPHQDFNHTLKLFKDEFAKRTNFDSWKENHNDSKLSYNYVSNYPSETSSTNILTDTLLGNLKDFGNVSISQKANRFSIQTEVEKVTIISDALSYVNFVNAKMCEKQRKFFERMAKKTISNLSTKMENKNEKELEATLAILAMERSYHNSFLAILDMNCDLVVASSRILTPKKSDLSLLAFLLSLMLAFWTTFALALIRLSKSSGKA